MDSPFGLLAELTYRCPLACSYCSNPLNLADYTDELSTGEWRRVLAEAADLGVLQCHLSGGEPLLRRDLVEIVAIARDLGLYTNLVTSAVGLSRSKAERLRAAGLDHVQISIQADERATSDRIAGTPSFERKIEAMGVVKMLGWPLTVNVVLHRHNIDRVAELLELAEEVAPTGWSWPTPSTTAGPGETATRCCRAGPSSRRPRTSCGPPASGWPAAWTSSTSFPTTTPDIPSPAWVAGRPGS